MPGISNDELIESIVTNFINGNTTDCKELIREYAESVGGGDVYDLLKYYDGAQRKEFLNWVERNKMESGFINTIYHALLNY